MKKKTIVGLIAIAVIVSVAIFTGCVEEETPVSAPSTVTPTPTPVPTTVLEPAKLVILSHSMTRAGNGGSTVTGQAKNVGDYDLDCAQIVIDWRDSAGNDLYTSSAYVSDLGPGQTWNFEVISTVLYQNGQPLPLYEMVAGYEIQVVRCNR